MQLCVQYMEVVLISLLQKVILQLQREKPIKKLNISYPLSLYPYVPVTTL